MVRRDRAAARHRDLRSSCAFAGEAIGAVETAKIAAAMLYLGEGGKSKKKSIVTFGNSDPAIIRLFLRLLRAAFGADESKLRATVQCRADQDIRKLTSHWSSVTGIPFERFYAPQVDRRTLGKPTRKPGYYGVLRIDYLSSMVFNELQLIAEILCEGR